MTKLISIVIILFLLKIILKGFKLGVKLLILAVVGMLLVGYYNQYTVIDYNPTEYIIAEGVSEK